MDRNSMKSEHRWRLSKIEAFYKRFALCPAYDMLLLYIGDLTFEQRVTLSGPMKEIHSKDPGEIHLLCLWYAAPIGELTFEHHLFVWTQSLATPIVKSYENSLGNKILFFSNFSFVQWYAGGRFNNFFVEIL